jgi:hypothetical protein
VGRGVSATYVATLVVAAFLSGCGGGNRATPSTGTTAAGPSSSSSPASPASSPASSPAPPPATAATGATPSGDAFWPYAKLVARLAGRTVTVSNATVRLDPALVECNGAGPVRRSGSTREWSRYICTQTVFQGGADNDVTFDVVISSATQLAISSPRTGPE